jgi:hypothetical protein
MIKQISTVIALMFGGIDSVPPNTIATITSGITDDEARVLIQAGLSLRFDIWRVWWMPWQKLHTVLVYCHKSDRCLAEYAGTAADVQLFVEQALNIIRASLENSKKWTQ